MLSAFSHAQTNSHLPLKSDTFDFVGVSERDNFDSSYYEVSQFMGSGEIYIYSDSITVAWSNECRL